MVSVLGSGFEVIDCDGVRVAVRPGFIGDRIARPLRAGRYERGERQGLERLLRPGDRVLDLGSGLGVVAAVCGRACPEGAVLSVEANPDLLPMIRETLRLNGVTNAELRHGAVVGPGAAPAAIPFYLRADFWASSMEPGSRPYEREVSVPALPLADLMAEFRPTVLSCDIEGGEDGLFYGLDLSGLRLAVIEMHPKAIGEDGVAGVRRALAAAGLAPLPQARPSTVVTFGRQAAAKPASPAPAWPPADPRILVATCMKDEGPFILEWVAWTKAIGVTDIVVFSNDCSDGSDRLLDRLDAMGEITHLPNPAASEGGSYLQPVALRYVQQMPVFRRVDFFLSCDVDEFLNIRVGTGRLQDLFAAVPPFDVLSACELVHGSNGRVAFEPGLVTELFPDHDTPRPGKWKARAGVKSIVRLGDRIAAVRNHRPDLAVPAAEAVWLDGSGRPMTDLARDRDQNGTDRRGRYDLVSLDHFPLRSVESFLVKMARGDVVVAGKRVSRRYWRVRDRNDHRSSDLAPGRSRARPVLDRLMADAELADCHAACIAAHRAMIDRLRGAPDYAERLDWILSLKAADGPG
ncbi:MAG: FkbM family methyltransferase [Rhodobacteraceae bacterium]|nr:FkbM family methyltransferase [Paracoccaceae bacterium]